MKVVILSLALFAGILAAPVPDPALQARDTGCFGDQVTGTINHKALNGASKILYECQDPKGHLYYYVDGKGYPGNLIGVDHAAWKACKALGYPEDSINECVGWYRSRAGWPSGF